MPECQDRDEESGRFKKKKIMTAYISYEVFYWYEVSWHRKDDVI